MEAHYIIESRKRCLEAGLDAKSIPFPKNRLSLIKLQEIQNKYIEVTSVMNFFGDKITKLMEGIPIFIALTDDRGYLISYFGNENIRETMDHLGITEGIQMNESDMGMNVVDLSIQQQQAVEVIGEQHFHHHLHMTACYSIPFHFADVDHLKGTVSIMTLLDFHGKFALPLFSNMVDSMEREIVLRRKNRNQDVLNHIMINTVNNGIIITDKNGYILELNQLIEKVTNCKREDMIGNSVFTIDSFGEYMQGVLADGNPIENIECTFFLSNNQRMICLLDAIPILDDRNEIMGSYLQIRDITERFELEQQIITSEKFSAIGKLAAGIAHEIRNPLTSVMGFIQLLRRNSSKNETESRYLEIVFNELHVLKKMVSDFVLMAKPSSPEKKETLLQELINDTVQFMTSQANLQDTVLKTELCEPPMMIFIDGVQIKQVLINLIQNAIEAMPDGGEVDIRLALDTENNYAEISICDTGVGIDEEQLKEIFNPFFTTKDNGLGLGLSICYRIIENHNGKIQIKSTSSGGTQFIILIPFHK